MGTASGIRSRRYHALLTTATVPPTGRVTLIAGAEVWLEALEGEAANEKVALSSQRYAPGVVHPAGYRHIVGFTAEPWPRWTFRVDRETTVEHEIFCHRPSGEVVLRWWLRGPRGGELAVRLLLAARDYHCLGGENPGFCFDAQITGGRTGGNVAWQPYPDRPAITALTNGRYQHDPIWYRQFLYVEERARGLDHLEDLGSPGIFRFRLEPATDIDAPTGRAVGTTGRESERRVSASMSTQSAGRTRPAVRSGRHAIVVLRAGRAPWGDAGAIAADHQAVEVARRGDPIERAVDAYLVHRGSALTVIAGYPWFTDWGRDTFIALRGMCLAPGRP
ncbi:MAG: glycogen debranching enzyme N-terminal domain-containing protein, partial [Geminicoccales bacterium]